MAQAEHDEQLNGLIAEEAEILVELSKGVIRDEELLTGMAKRLQNMSLKGSSSRQRYSEEKARIISELVKGGQRDQELSARIKEVYEVWPGSPNAQVDIPSTLGKLSSMCESSSAQEFCFSKAKTGKDKAVMIAMRQLGLVSLTAGELPLSLRPRHGRQQFSIWPSSIPGGVECTNPLELLQRFRQQLASLGVCMDEPGGCDLKSVAGKDGLGFTCGAAGGQYIFHGGPDAVIVPHGELMWQLQTRLIVKWATSAILPSFLYSDGRLELVLLLLGALHHSNHPSLVVMTDGNNFIILQPHGAAIRYLHSLSYPQAGRVTRYEAIRYIAHHLQKVSRLETAFSYKNLEILPAGSELRWEAAPLLAAKQLQRRADRQGEQAESDGESSEASLPVLHYSPGDEYDWYP